MKSDAFIFDKSYYGGEWRAAASGERFDVVNPASGQLLAKVPSLAAADIEKAICAAEAAFVPWKTKLASERAGLLRKWFNLLIENKEALGELITREQGKPLSEAIGEIVYAASFIEWFAEEAKRVYGEIIPPHQQDMQIEVSREPVGVCAAIAPWNFPAAMITRKVGAALAAGCTMIVKPASKTPLTALALAQLAEKAGIPAGVLNVVTGDASAIGKVLTESPVIRKLSFTGSTDTGRRLAADCAPTLKRVSLELGGNAPFIVCDDADIDEAVKQAMASKFRNAGQTCVCANRILVQDAVYEAFLEKFTQAVKALKVGDGLEKDVQIGPLIDEKAVEKVQKLLKNALNSGATLITGGKPHALGGTFFEPTVLSDVPPDAEMAKVEIFGPVAPLYRFKTDDEAIAMANDTEFGLAAYVCVRDAKRLYQYRDRLEYGMVGVNTGLISTEIAPFGGIKQSGYGREGSRHGIDEYLQMKYACIQL